MEKLLVICSECKRFRLDEEHGFWLDETDNPKVYAELKKEHKKTLSHGLCPEDIQRYKQEYNI